MQKIATDPAARRRACGSLVRRIMTFDRALRRCSTLINLSLIAAIAHFQASGISYLIAAALVPRELADNDSALRERPVVSALAASDDHATVARAILDNNPFDSVTPRPLDAAHVTSSPTLVGLESYERAPLCDEFKAVVVVASPDPAWSMAALSGGGDVPAKIVRLGESVGNQIVRIIEWNRVVLSSRSALCQVVMFQSNKHAALSDAGTRDPPPNAAPRGGVPLEIASKIHRVGTTEVNVDRQAVAEILDNQMDLLRSVRIVPEQVNGKVIGIRLYGIGPDTLLGMLGLEQGDRLDTINGFEMTNLEKGMQALAKLRTADHLFVQVNRHGRDTTLDFNLR